MANPLCLDAMPQWELLSYTKFQASGLSNPFYPLILPLANESADGFFGMAVCSFLFISTNEILVFMGHIFNTYLKTVVELQTGLVMTPETFTFV